MDHHSIIAMKPAGSYQLLKCTSYGFSGFLMQVRLSGSVRPSVMPQAAVHLGPTLRDLVAEGRLDGQGWHMSTSQTWSVGDKLKPYFPGAVCLHLSWWVFPFLACLRAIGAHFCLLY